MLAEIKGLWEGLCTVFRHVAKRPVTLEYPEKKRILNDNFRGKPTVNLLECVGCGVCKKVCPTGAICFQKGDDGNVSSYVFDLKKCMFCGNCQYYCPKGAISMSNEYELGTDNKDNLEIHMEARND